MDVRRARSQGTTRSSSNQRPNVGTMQLRQLRQTCILFSVDNKKVLTVAIAPVDGPAYQGLAVPTGLERNRVRTVGSKLAFTPASEVEFLVSSSTTTKSDARRLPVRRHRSPALTPLRRAPARHVRPWPAEGLRHQEARRAAAPQAGARTWALAGTAPATRRG
jgi:hypothetical protein